MKRLHWPLAKGVIECLHEIFNLGSYADKVIEKKFRHNKKWGVRDRAFVAEATYDIVRWWYRYLYQLNQDFILPQNTKSPLSEKILWHVLACWLLENDYSLPSWETLKGFSPSRLSSNIEGAPPWALHSMQEWLYQQGKEELKNQWEKELIVLNKPADIFLRVNFLKIKRRQLQRLLSEEGIFTEEVSEVGSALRLQQRANVFNTQAFKKGYFEVQDAGSQCIAPLLEVEPGQRVIDACAGAGGKSLHLAALMNNKGKILSLDIYEWKLDELKKRADRNSVDIIERRSIENSKIIKRNIESCDRLLLDVPCSGTGVLKRNPDTKWKLTPEKLANVISEQSEILESYSRMVKNGGKMVYATCSLFPSENEKQVQNFLQSHPEWQKEEELHIFPSESSFDGFYACRMVKNK